MKTNIVVKLTFEGVHCWPKCNIKEVMFLRNPHRHIFFVKCKKEVNHNDRDIEIIQLKRQIEKYLSAFKKDFGSKSCEMIATLLVKEFNLNYCEVLEDNENGAEVFKERQK